MFRRQASPSDEEGTSLPSTAAGVPVASAEMQSPTGDCRVSSDPSWLAQDWDVNSDVNDPVRASCDVVSQCCVAAAAVPFLCLLALSSSQLLQEVTITQHLVIGS